MTHNTKWQKGEPNFDGLYMVAIRYPNGLGELDLLMWRGAWHTLYEEEIIPSNYHVVAYMSTTDLINSFTNCWPEWDT